MDKKPWKSYLRILFGQGAKDKTAMHSEKGTKLTANVSYQEACPRLFVSKQC